MRGVLLAALGEGYVVLEGGIVLEEEELVIGEFGRWEDIMIGKEEGGRTVQRLNFLSEGFPANSYKYHQLSTTLPGSSWEREN